MNPVLVGLVLVVGLWLAAAPLLATRPSRTPPPDARGGRRASAGRGARDHLALLDAVLTAYWGVLVLRIALPWEVVPPVLWSVAVALAALGTTLAVPRWRVLPVATGPRPRLRATGAGVGVLAALGVSGLIIGG